MHGYIVNCLMQCVQCNCISLSHGLGCIPNTTHASALLVALLTVCIVFIVRVAYFSLITIPLFCLSLLCAVCFGVTVLCAVRSILLGSCVVRMQCSAA